MKQETAKKEPKFRFERASVHHQQIIFDWLSKPHMIEFWDNSQEHKDDILNFIHGRKQNYICGTTTYWVGVIDEEAFCFVLSDPMLSTQSDLSELHRAHLSKTGHTISIDFGIGNTKFLGQGLAAPALKAFMDYYSSQVDQKADVFFIDPDFNNPRAKHVYEKAGFELVGNYSPIVGAFVGHQSHLLVKKLR